MSIYTRSGDGGETDIIGGKRILKSDKRICAMGAVSQVYSNIEAAIVFLKNDVPIINEDLEKIFKTLLNCCYDLALDCNDNYKIKSEDIKFLEKRIDEYEKELSTLNGFVRIGLCEASAFLNIAMTMTRWAERETVSLYNDNKNINKNLMKYLNRLSDYLFCAARYVNKTKGLSQSVDV